jgi:hypothetical protein
VKINDINGKITKSCKDGAVTFLLSSAKKMQRTRTAQRRRKIHHPNDKWVSNYNQSTNYKSKSKRRRATNTRMYTGVHLPLKALVQPFPEQKRMYVGGNQ